MQKLTTLFFLLLISSAVITDEGEHISEEQFDELQKEAEMEEMFDKNGEHEAYLNQATFLEEYKKEKSSFPEVEAARNFFPTEDYTISRERYSVLLNMFLDGTVHDMEIHEDIREEAIKQIQEHSEEYLSTVKGELEEFMLNDFIEDAIEAKYHDWLDKTYPEIDPEIEGEDL